MIDAGRDGEVCSRANSNIVQHLPPGKRVDIAFDWLENSNRYFPRVLWSVTQNPSKAFVFAPLKEFRLSGARLDCADPACAWGSVGEILYFPPRAIFDQQIVLVGYELRHCKAYTVVARGACLFESSKFGKDRSSELSGSLRRWRCQVCSRVSIIQGEKNSTVSKRW